MVDRSARYPLHDLHEKEPPHQRLCASPLILPEQVGRKSAGRDLWCLGCEALVVGVEGDFGKATRAAAAEGLVAHERTAPLTPGDLDAKERECLYWLIQSEADGVTHEEHSALMSRAKDTKAGDRLVGRGLAEGAAAPILTPAGRAMAALVAAPVVDVARLKFDPAHTPKPPKAKKKREPKKRSEEPEGDPLACACSHGVTMHRATGDGPCQAPGCDCKRWHKTAKSKRSKRSKAA